MSDKKESMLAVTVDVEDWYHIPSVTGSPFSQYLSVNDFFSKWKGRYDFLSDSTKRVLDLLDDLGVQATFFVVADVVNYYPGLLEKIVERGHEIACHGLHHICFLHPKTKKPLISQAEFEYQVSEGKRRLEGVAGQEIIGFRAPNAYIAGWMLDSLEKVGYKYDSSVSLNSLSNKLDSKPKRVETAPYYPRRGSLEVGNEERILEIPWPFWNILGLKFPTAGGPFLRFFGARYIMAGLKQCLQKGHTVFYFHPIDICREKFPGNFSLHRPFYWLMKGGYVKRRIKHILSHIGAEFGTCRNVWERVRQEKKSSK